MAGAVMAMAANTAAAHAIVVEAVPAAGSTVVGREANVSIRFNGRIDRARSRLLREMPDGRWRPVALRPDGPPDTLAGHIEGLEPGPASLRWEVLSSDGHLSRGYIPFTVRSSP